MSTPIADSALDQLFREARSIHRFLSREIPDETLNQIYALSSLGPTGFNSQPARYLFLRSKPAKERLLPALSTSNREKTFAAPVNVIVAWDSRFHEHLPEQFPAYDAKSFFDKSPNYIEPTATTNATLQAAYFFLAVRALGLDVGPMSGFNAAALDKEFFPDGRFRSFLVANIGYGDRSQLAPRGPRLSFDDVATIL
jgi:3-hydroxypropanoate dehydrogenase